MIKGNGHVTELPNGFVRIRFAEVHAKSVNEELKKKGFKPIKADQLEITHANGAMCIATGEVFDHPNQKIFPGRKVFAGCLKSGNVFPTIDGESPLRNIDVIARKA